MNEIIVVTDEKTEAEAEVIDEKIEDMDGEFEEEFSDAERQKYYEEMLDDEINDILKDYELYSYYCGKLWQKGSDKEAPVSTFLPIPVLDITYDNGSDQKRFFAIKGLKRVNGKIVTLPETKVKAEDCSSMNWITPSWGMSAFICPPMQSRKDALRGIMFDIGQRTAERKTIYSHTGWREMNGEWFYLHGGGAIGADGVEVDLEGKLGSYNMECRKQNFISCTNALADLFRVSKPEVMLSSEMLTAKISEKSEKYSASRDELKEMDSRIKLLEEQIHEIDVYRKTKPVVEGMEKVVFKERYKKQHESEFILYAAAEKSMKKYFGGGKIPLIKTLRAEQNDLKAQRAELKSHIDNDKKELDELRRMQRNIDIFLGKDRQAERSRSEELS